MKVLKLLAGLALSIYSILFGLFFYFFGTPYIVKDQIHHKVSLHNGSEVYPVWVNMDFLEFNTYLFNVTNPEEVTQGKKPIVNEMGPFCFKLHRVRKEIKVDEMEDTVDYWETRYFYPTFSNRERECKSQDVMITVLNVPLMATVQLLGKIAPDLIGTFGEAVPLLFGDIKNAFLTVKVSDLLFNGVSLNCSIDDFTLGMVCKSMREMAPPQLQPAANNVDYEFALLRWMNNTQEGPFRISRGVKNVSTTGHILAWKGKEMMEYWKSDDCNEYKGTDAYILPPFDADQKSFDVFSVDLCRAVTLHFMEDVEVFGLETKRYEVREDSMGASERNKCFCPTNKVEDSDVEEMACLKSGTINVSPCVNNAPVIFSWPHFYLGAEEYQKSVDGLNPNADKHRTEEYVAPQVGAPVLGYKRAQVNFFMDKNDEIEMLNDIYEGIMPVMWIEEGAVIPNDFRWMLIIIFTFLKFWNYVLIGMMIGGTISCVVFIVLLLVNKKENTNEPPAFQAFEHKAPPNPYVPSVYAPMVQPYKNPIKLVPNLNMVEQFNQYNHRGNQRPPPPFDYNGGGNNIKFVPQLQTGSFYD